MPFARAAELNLSYSTVTRWLARFRENGMRGLFPAAQISRQPYTPEKVIVSLVFYKTCVRSISDRELARVMQNIHHVSLHHETVKALLERYFFWRHEEFNRLVTYPIPADIVERRLEIVKLYRQGWSETSVAKLLKVTRKTVQKWVRRRRKFPKSRWSPTSKACAAAAELLR